MSAPHAVTGEPSWDELMVMLDSFERCGIRGIGLTGGEPLIRKDFWPLVDEIREKLKNAFSDKAACKILADNGVNVEALEKKAEDFGIPVKKLSLSENLLDKVAGGFSDENYGYDISCPCGNSGRDQFSRQFWATLFTTNTKAIYRCKNCSRYFRIVNDHNIQILTKDEYDDESYPF